MRGMAGTIFLLATIAIAFAVELARGALGNDTVLLSLGALPDSGQLLGQYWRILSFGLLHADLNHFVLNVALLLWVCPVVERRVGPAFLVPLFFAASVLSGVAILLKHVVEPSVGTSVGASGGLFGLLGAALVLVYRIPPANPALRRGLWLTLLGGIAFSLLPGVSMAGHVTGLLVGVLAALLVRLHPASRIT